MGFFYERTETKDKVVVKYFPTFVLPILLFILGIVVSTWIYEIGGPIVALLFPLPFLAMIWLFGMHMKNVSEEVAKARREGRVKTSGSRWSFSNPLTVEIEKG